MAAMADAAFPVCLQVFVEGAEPLKTTLECMVEDSASEKSVSPHSASVAAKHTQIHQTSCCTTHSAASLYLLLSIFLFFRPSLSLSLCIFLSISFFVSFFVCFLSVLAVIVYSLSAWCGSDLCAHECKHTATYVSLGLNSRSQQIGGSAPLHLLPACLSVCFFNSSGTHTYLRLKIEKIQLSMVPSGSQ